MLGSLAAIATACGGDDGGGDDAADTGGTAGVSDSGTAGPADDGPSSADDDGPSTSPGTTGGPATGTDDGTSTPADDDGTTGTPVELCNGWSDENPGAPWLELDGADGQPLSSGGVLELLCGGQGSWMLPIYPHMGGWEPAEPLAYFDVVVDVEGFDTGPTGHFYEALGLYYGLECFDGGDLEGGGFGGHACIAIFPPDDLLEDLSVLDGATATIHVSLDAPGEPIVYDYTDMTISAPAETIENGCFI